MQKRADKKAGHGKNTRPSTQGRAVLREARKTGWILHLTMDSPYAKAPYNKEGTIQDKLKNSLSRKKTYTKGKRNLWRNDMDNRQK